jgi:hypothetical protein
VVVGTVKSVSRVLDWKSNLIMLHVADGLAPPVEEWQKAVREHLEKVKKLEDIYENELILRKV